MKYEEELIIDLQEKISSLEHKVSQLKKVIAEYEKMYENLNAVPIIIDTNLNLQRIFLEEVDIVDENGNVTLSSNQLLKRAFHALKRGGFHYLSELQNKRLKDLLNIYNIGESSIALIYLICQHYNITIIMDDTFLPPYKQKSLKSCIEKYENSINFKNNFFI